MRINPTDNVPDISEPLLERIIPGFRVKFYSIQGSFNKVRELNRTITTLDEKYNSIILLDQHSTSNNELESMLNESMILFRRIKEEIENLENQTNRGSSETRVKQATCKAFKARFQVLLKESQSVYIEYKNVIKANLTRNLNIIDPDLPEGEIETIFNDPARFDEFIIDKTPRTGIVKLSRFVNGFQERYKDIYRLERAIENTHYISTDMEVLERLGIETIDERAIVIIEEHQPFVNIRVKRRRKYKYYIIFTILLIIIVALIVVFLCEDLFILLSALFLIIPYNKQWQLTYLNILKASV